MAIRSSSPLFPMTLFFSPSLDMTLNISATAIMIRKHSSLYMWKAWAFRHDESFTVRGRKEMTKIQYENLIIRQAEVADAKQLTAWRNDGAVMAHAGFSNGSETTIHWQLHYHLRFCTAPFPFLCNIRIHKILLSVSWCLWISRCCPITRRAWPLHRTGRPDR